MERQSAWQQLYDTLKSEVLSGVYPARHVFTEPEVGERFGVSRTPVREALGLLEKEGLVQRLPYRGYIVSTYTMNDALDLIELRVILEREAVRLVATRKGPLVADELEQVNINGLAGTLPAIDADRQFHRIIARESGNRLMEEVLLSLYDKFIRLENDCIAAFTREDILWGHGDTIAALRRCDPDGAAASIVLQLRRFQDAMLRRS